MSVVDNIRFTFLYIEFYSMGRTWVYPESVIPYSIFRYIEKGKAEGAKLLCGGYKCTDDDLVNGNFIKPAIFDDCTSDMSIVREEIFGPVLTVLTFETEEEAIELANDTDYGLAGAVFCNDTAKALRVIKEVRAGITWINCVMILHLVSF